MTKGHDLGARTKAVSGTLFRNKQLVFKGHVPFPARGWWGRRLCTSPADSGYPLPPGVHWWGTVIRRQTFKKYTKSAPTHPLGSGGPSLTQTTCTPSSGAGGHGRKRGGVMAECHVSTCHPATCEEVRRWILFSVPLLNSNAQPQEANKILRVKIIMLQQKIQYCIKRLKKEEDMGLVRLGIQFLHLAGGSVQSSWSNKLEETVVREIGTVLTADNIVSWLDCTV